MIKTVCQFFASLRETLFVIRIEREIYGRIFPHLQREQEHGYTFNSDADLAKRIINDYQEVLLTIRTIEKRGAQMPLAYGRSFRYIVYRDIGRRLAMYEKLARRRIRRHVDPRFVATAA